LCGRPEQGHKLIGKNRLTEDVQVQERQQGSDPVHDAATVESQPTDLRRDYFFLLGLAGLIVVLDQWTKGLVRSSLVVGETWVPWDWLAPHARIVHWRNTGAAFGMFQDFGLFFTVLAILVSGAIIYYFPQVPRRDWSLRLALGLQLGGAVGNLIDRLTLMEVTDFISVGSFPVFNVADSSIFVGASVLILGMLLRNEEPKAPDPSLAPGTAESTGEEGEPAG
jgi:signal peptidase II